VAALVRVPRRAAFSGTLTMLFALTRAEDAAGDIAMGCWNGRAKIRPSDGLTLQQLKRRI